MGIAGESEKSRLQRIMEWSNRGVGTPEPNRRRDDEAGTEEEQLIRKKVRGGVQKAKRWLDVLANEVVERETVLKVMRAEGQEQLSNTKLRDQIQQRIKRMKELQNIISRQERINKQSRMEAVLEDPTACCPATCSVQQQKDKTEATSQANSFSPQSKRLLDHGLSTSQNPPRNHHRYKHTHSAANLPFLEGSSAVNRALEHLLRENHHQKEHHHRHHHHHHHRHNEVLHHHRDKQLEGTVKPSNPSTTNETSPRKRIEKHSSRQRHST